MTGKSMIFMVYAIATRLEPGLHGLSLSKRGIVMGQAGSIASDRAPVSRIEGVGLAIVLAIAIAARVFRLDASLWYDEILTVVNFVRLPTLDLVGTYDSFNNHMLYSLAAKLCVSLFGEHPWALRLPAVIFGIAAIAVQWLIARRLLGPWPALATALLLSLSYHHVWFSQNARGYTGLLLWTSAATLAFVDGIARPSWRNWIVYGVCVALAMYVHLSAIFFFMAHGAAYLLMLVSHGLPDRKARIMPVWGALIGGALALAVYAPILGKMVATVKSVSTASSSASGAALAEWRNPLRAFQEVAISVSAAGVFTPALIVAALIVLIAGIASLAKRDRMMTAIYVIHVPLAVALLSILSVRIWPRYFFVDIGFIMMALVHGVFVLSAWFAPVIRIDRRWLTGACVAAMVVVSVGLLARNYSYPKQDFIGARDFVLHSQQRSDAVVAVSLAGYAYGHYYAPRWKVAESAAELERIRAGANTTWVLIAFPHMTSRARPEIMTQLSRDFDKVADFPGTMGDGAIWVYRSRKPAG